MTIQYCIFLHILSFFIDHGLFSSSRACLFFGILAHSTYLQDIAFCLRTMRLFIVHGWIFLQFTYIFCIFVINGRDRTVENSSNISKNLRVSRLNK